MVYRDRAGAKACRPTIAPTLHFPVQGKPCRDPRGTAIPCPARIDLRQSPAGFAEVGLSEEFLQNGTCANDAQGRTAPRASPAACPYRCFVHYLTG